MQGPQHVAMNKHHQQQYDADIEHHYLPDSGDEQLAKLYLNGVIAGQHQQFGHSVLLAIVVSILRPNFLGESNIRNLFGNTAIRFIIALGVSGCLITKGTDLSAGRTAGFSACMAATSAIAQADCA